MTFIERYLKGNKRTSVVFLGAFLLLCLVYNFQHELFVRPHSFHIWRQTDGFCIANNYYQVSMNFLHPRISQFISDDGLELAEFPITYYVSAIGYQLFGFHECIPRLVSLLIVLFGLWCLFKLLADILSDHYYAIILSLLLFTSPVLIFYSLVPLPDIAGMPLAIAGLYYFYKYLKTTKSGYLCGSILLYAIAGSIKPTSILSLITIITVYGLVAVFPLLRGEISKQFIEKLRVPMALFSIASIGSIASWWLYVGYYRNLHHTSYFQVHADPIWEKTKDEIAQIWTRFDLVLMNNYFNKPTLIIAGLLVLMSLTFYTRQVKVFFLSYLIFLLGCICYFLLFYSDFYEHDYYIIVLLPLFIASLFLFLIAIKYKHPHIFNALWFKGILLLLFLCNVGHAAIKNERRKTDLYFCQSDHIELTHIEPYLNSIGVKQSDLVVYWGDISPNTAFYLMNRRGWGLWALDGSLTIEGIDKCTAKGAKFLIIDQNQIKVDSLSDVIKKYEHHKISDRDNIQIYSLL